MVESLKNFGSLLMLDPASIVSLEITPARFELVPESPDELSVDGRIVGSKDTLAHGLEVSFTELGRVDRALTVAGDIDQVGAKGTLHVGVAVHINSKRLRDVGLGAVNPLALVSAGRLAVVEVVEPESASVSCERPLAYPHLVLVAREQRHLVVVLLTDVRYCATVGVPSQVEMSVYHDVMDIIVSKEVVPVLRVLPEGVVEDKLEMRSLCSHKITYVAIEDLQGPLVRLIPWLVHGLNSIEGGMCAPFVNKATDCVLGPEERVEVDVVVALAIPRSHPLSGLDRPMCEMILIDPFQMGLFARVVESVLTAFDGMYIK